MAVAFDENARFIATAISCEVMAALKSFNAIMATFYGRVVSHLVDTIGQSRAFVIVKFGKQSYQVVKTSFHSHTLRKSSE